MVKYTYDFNGVRTSKTLKSGSKGAFAVNYIYDGNNLIAEQRGTKLITYFYGVDGVAGFEYEENTYIYRKNVQGDITHIYKKLADGTLELVAKYVYDAWGNHDILDAEGKIVERKENVIANINPFRYRGYYFDVETNLYYLQTRYYDPELGRFISSDSIEYIDPKNLGGLNLYAYCGNNPVMNVDPTGKFLFTFLAVLATLAVGALIGGVCGGISAAASGGDFWAGFAGGAVSGLISTVGMCLAVTTGGIGGLLIAGAFGFAAGFAGSIVQQGIEKGWDKIDWSSAAISGGISAISNMICYGFTNFAMRESVGLFEHIFDKSIKFSQRFVSALAISPEALLVTGMFSLPTSVAAMLIEIARNSIGKYGSKINA